MYSTCALLTGLTAISLIKISPPTRPHLKGNSGVRKKDCKLRCQSVVCQQQLKREATSQIKNSSSSAFPPPHTYTHTHRQRNDSCFMNSYNFSPLPTFPSFFACFFSCFFLGYFLLFLSMLSASSWCATGSLFNLIGVALVLPLLLPVFLQLSSTYLSSLIS